MGFKEQLEEALKRVGKKEKKVSTDEDPGWLPKKPVPVDPVDQVIEEWVRADTEIEVEDYVHRPNTEVSKGIIRVVAFKDGRIALLGPHVGFIIRPEDVQFISNLSTGLRE